MSENWKIAIIGLDTSHSTAFPELMQDPKTPENLQIHGIRTVSCLRFETPFQNKEGLDKRQEYLESIGVKVTENFEEAVQDCDAIIIAINDPRCHAEYFEKCASVRIFAGAVLLIGNEASKGGNRRAETADIHALKQRPPLLGKLAEQHSSRHVAYHLTGGRRGQ